ncbi:MAG: rhamnogalacturonan acetylesterase [Rikenellaceae bacterium]|nr:rhamnogalacturonan acetylesterase [Rikenellaceae bacterium]
MADTNLVIDNTLDSLNKVRTVRPEAGSSRKGDNPVLFLVGDSTMRTGTRGNGDNGQWGWGYYVADYFDLDRITVENQALGGMSSRTFYNRLWPDVLKGVRAGDWVVIQIGHNDSGPYDSGRARSSIPGAGEEYLDVTIQETGAQERVYTYGGYLRKYVADVREKGAYPVLVSLTPRNRWNEDGSLQRYDDTFTLWIRQVAEEQQVPFIDLNKISSDKFERFDRRKVDYMFYLDNIHTSAFGAKNNVESFVEGLRAQPQIELASYLKAEDAQAVAGKNRVGDRPVLFVVGDSTVKIDDTPTSGMVGWGDVLQDYFDASKITVDNQAKAGRSSRTFLDEGRWEKVYKALRPGDYVLIQFGHNDGSEINTGKARGTIWGNSDDSRVLLMQATGRFQVIYSFGWYIRKFCMDAIEKGAIPIVLSHTPRNQWNEDGSVKRCVSTYGTWSREAAEQTGALFIDLNEISAAKMEAMGREAAAAHFQRDHTHSSELGARRNAQSIVEGVLALDGCALGEMVKK